MHLAPYSSRSDPQTRRRGVAAVELAVISPFLAVLVLGMIEMGHALMVKETLSDAAQKACRLAAQPNTTTAQAQAEVDNIMQDSNMAGYSTAILVNGNNTDIQSAVHNDQISIKVSVPASNALWMPPVFLPITDIESETVIMLRQG
jgi:Flp pilus assembly protein TadG